MPSSTLWPVLATPLCYTCCSCQGSWGHFSFAATYRHTNITISHTQPIYSSQRVCHTLGLSECISDSQVCSFRSQSVSASVPVGGERAHQQKHYAEFWGNKTEVNVLSVSEKLWLTFLGTCSPLLEGTIFSELPPLPCSGDYTQSNDHEYHHSKT